MANLDLDGRGTCVLLAALALAAGCALGDKQIGSLDGQDSGANGASEDTGSSSSNEDSGDATDGSSAEGPVVTSGDTTTATTGDESTLCVDYATFAVDCSGLDYFDFWRDRCDQALAEDSVCVAAAVAMYECFMSLSCEDFNSEVASDEACLALVDAKMEACPVGGSSGSDGPGDDATGDDSTDSGSTDDP